MAAAGSLILGPDSDGCGECVYAVRGDTRKHTLIV